MRSKLPPHFPRLEHPPPLWQRIYHVLRRHCQPYSLPGPWSDLPADGDTRAAPADSHAVITPLLNAFEPSSLVRAGVARETAEGAVVPAVALSGGGPLVFLRPHPDKFPVEVLTATGGLIGRCLPVVAALRDSWTLVALETWQCDLHVVFTLEDVAVLRALGLPATPAAGLEDLDTGKVDSILEHCRWTRGLRLPNLQQDDLYQSPTDFGEEFAGNSPRSGKHARTSPPGCSPESRRTGEKTTQEQAPPAQQEGVEKDQESTAANPRSILLWGWSPARLLTERPARLDAVVAQLRAIHRHLDVDNMQLGVWSPREVWLERLRFLVPRYSDRLSPREFLDEIEESAGDALYDSPSVASPSPPAQLAGGLHAHCQSHTPLGPRGRGAARADVTATSREPGQTTPSGGDPSPHALGAERDRPQQGAASMSKPMIHPESGQNLEKITWRI
jgi:hypothetical protein